MQRATDAKTNTDNSQIQERINLAYHSSLVDGQGIVTESSLENELKKEFNKDSLDEKWLDKTSVKGKWKITIDNVSLDVSAGKETEDNKVTIKVGTTNLKDVSNLSTLYGEITDFTSVTNVQWQLFYDDNEYIYLIASDYVQVAALPNELLKQSESNGETKCWAWFATNSNNTYAGTIMETAPWNAGTESTTLSNSSESYPVVNKYLRWVGSGLDITTTNPNMKAIAYMLDTNKWKSFAGEKGAFAIGGPTLEMFIASYNAKHDVKLSTYSTPINSNEANSYGYNLKWESYAYWTTSLPDLDTTDSGTTEGGNMWVKASTNNNAYGYWLASPSSGNKGCVLEVTKDGSIASYADIRYACGFRPIVAILKSSMK